MILSDVHLGTPDCKAREVNHFLCHIRCEKLILNGDIIDSWQLQRAGHWTKVHMRFTRIVLKMLEKRDTHIIYVRGNHDDVLASFLPLKFENLQIVEDHIHEGLRGRYFVLHGDVFGTITRNFAFLSHLGNWGYHVLLKLNRAYNAWRALRGKEYWSLSKAIKARVKSAVSHVSKFEDHIARLAKERRCTGVMCGHIHTPGDKMIGDIHYLNSGDWIESLTAIVEHCDGRFELVDYVTFLRDHPMPAEEPPMGSALESVEVSHRVGPRPPRRWFQMPAAFVEEARRRGISARLPEEDITACWRARHRQLRSPPSARAPGPRLCQVPGN